MNALVSIVIIFLNADRFLREAIDSVRQQTHPHWELLLVDDGSRDGSTAIARAAEQGEPDRIRYLDHPGHENRGTSVSRNVGLQAACGDHILYLDADDILFPGALERLVGIMAVQPEAGLVCGTTLFWFWASEFAHRIDATQPYARWHDQLLPPPRFLSAILRYEIFHPANCSTLIRTALLREVGGFDPAFRGMFEDTAMMAKLLLVAKVHVLDEILSAYRMHPSSLCHTALSSGTYHFSAPNADRERYLRWLQRVVAQERVRNWRLALTLRWELWAYGRLTPPPWMRRLLSACAGLIRAARRLRPPPPAGPASSPPGPSSTIVALQALEDFYRRNQRFGDAEALRHRWHSQLDEPVA